MWQVYAVLILGLILLTWYHYGESFCTECQRIFTRPAKPVNVALAYGPMRRYANRSYLTSIPGYVRKTAVGCCGDRPEGISSKSYDRKTYDAVDDSSLPLRPGTIYVPEIYKPAKTAPLERVILLYSPASSKHNLVATFEQVQKHAYDSAAQRGIHFEKVVRDKCQINEYESLPRVVKIKNNGQVFVYRGYTDFGALYDWVMSDAKFQVPDYF